MLGELGDQTSIGHGLGVDDPAQRVLADMRVVTVVEQLFQFFEVAIQMLDTHPVEPADDRPLEEAPHAFDAVGVHIAT